MSFIVAVTTWYARTRKNLQLEKQVHVSQTGTAYGERTTVRIDHRVPSAGDSASGWRITTSDQYLPRAHFDRRVREKINSASVERGRRLYCIDRSTGEVIAAMSYHLDNKKAIPVMLTAIGLRVDEHAPPDLYDRSRGAAYFLKQYVHVVANKVGRDACVDIDADDVAALRDLGDLGFQRAPQVRGQRTSATRMRQLPLG